jgi:NADH-quinone oxidoreductase subunit C
MADDPKAPQQPPTVPDAAADKPTARPDQSEPGKTARSAEPLTGEVSRTGAPGAGASAGPVAGPSQEPTAQKPVNPAAAVTATTGETSSMTGKPTPTAQAAGTQASGPQPTGPKAPPRPPAGPKPPAGAASAAGHAAHPPAAAPPTGPPDPPPPANVTPPAFIDVVRTTVPGGVSAVSYWVGDWTIIVPVASLLAVARCLRDAPEASFDYCSDVTATDWPPRAERFDVVYCLYSTRHRHRIRMKVKAADQQPVPSVTGIWPAANWLEREVFDMFGVNFTGHPDRRRILMPEDWQGHPQRKDYPLEGPGELLMENPLDWLKLRQARDEADIE